MFPDGSCINLHDLPYVSWVGSVLYISCTTSHTGRLDLDDLDHDLCDVWNVPGWADQQQRPGGGRVLVGRFSGLR